ncbi:hypothetical protein EMIHUDRAFT_238253 [Emiliania huxleyi CCMP1516]|uniref:Uncharacterized protein n=2 Tax=Emiliania huxleyi TaxID=2903 RepID=A0A0D3JMW2_EMIH1|nr:hypothetical protein EMIHUDRAFT_238253 [Emiliania huxleyi CCMP1516]EOD24847.1 hypothetical protein EMIHUDRAFT_238253 [Emiliania huxleyi CCMP1516]|eukprot:XP_005777276.1 hypothetical protein EMIHUDRAFT_238253 [Emiliania huxleyi CCMP1516]
MVGWEDGTPPPEGFGARARPRGEFFWAALLQAPRSPMLARGAKSLRASSLRPAGLRLASGVPARTPEQTEHLEKLAEEHNGFLFGEVPPPPGEKRKKEDWEYYYPPLMTSALALFLFTWLNQPLSSVEDEAMEEAKRRMGFEPDVHFKQ